MLSSFAAVGYIVMNLTNRMMILLLLISFGRGVDAFVLSNPEVAPLIRELSLLKDSTASFSIQEVITKDFVSIDHPYSLNTSDKDVYWIRFKLEDELIEHPVIEFFSWAEVKVYFVKNDEWVVRRTGSMVPFFDRDIQLRNRLLIGDLGSDDNFYYARLLVSTNSLQLANEVELVTYPRDILLIQDNQGNDIRVFVNGFLLCLLIFLVFLYFLTRDKGFLYASLYIIICIYNSIHNSGELLVWFSFYKELPSYYAFLDVLATAIIIIVAIRTVYEILDFELNFPREKRFLDLLIVVYALFPIATLFTSHRVYLVHGIYGVLTVAIIYVLYISFVAIKRKIQFAWIFTLANLPFLGGALYYLIGEVGIITKEVGNDRYMLLGILAQSCLFAMMFAFRYENLKRANEDKQREIIRRLRENEKFLKNWKEAALKAESLERQNAISQYEALKNQISPHFLFNSLSVLTQLVYENKDQAAIFIKELSQVYRYILDHKNKPTVYLGEELDGAKAYIFLLKIRFFDSLYVDIQINDDYKNHYLIPPLVLQMLLENAIKHNKFGKKNPLFIKVFTYKSTLIVNNNLNPLEISQNGTKIGLDNIRSRYEVLTNERVEIRSSKDEFEVRIPLIPDD